MSEQTGTESQGGEREPTTNQQEDGTAKDMVLGCLGLLVIVVLLGWGVHSCWGGEDKPRISSQMVEEMAMLYVGALETRLAEMELPTMVDTLRGIPISNRRAATGEMVDNIFEQMPPDSLNYSVPSTREYADWYRSDADVERVREAMIRLLMEMVQGP